MKKINSKISLLPPIPDKLSVNQAGKNNWLNSILKTPVLDQRHLI